MNGRRGEGDRAAGTVADEILETLSVVLMDANAAVQAEAFGVGGSVGFTGSEGAAVLGAADLHALGHQRVQGAGAEVRDGIDVLEVLIEEVCNPVTRGEQNLTGEATLGTARGMEDGALFFACEHAIGNDDMQVHVEIEGGAEAMHERDGAVLAADALSSGASPVALVEFAHEDADNLGEKLGVSGEVPSHPSGKTQHSLPDRNLRNDGVTKVGGAVTAAARCARRTETASFARKADEKAVAAIGSACASKPIGQNATAKKAAQLASHVPGDADGETGVVTRLCEEAVEMGRDGSVQRA